MRSPLLLAAPLLLGGCLPNLCPEVDALPDDGDVLAIGDSIQAWNHHRCQAPPDHLGLLRDRFVENLAVSGSKLLSGQDAIPGQYVSDAWDTVIVDGGGNDLNQDCGCQDCAALLDSLAAADGRTGAMPDLVDDVLADGVGQVLVLGYYPMPDEAWYGFDACDAALTELNARYRTMAEVRDGVTYVDLGEVVQPGLTPEYYDFDQVHPSAEGAEAIAARLLQELDAGE